MGAERPASAPLWLVVTHARDARFQPMLEASGAAPWTRVLLASSFADVRTGMAASDALALPRRASSGFPIKLLNYMAAAKPVVTRLAGERLLGADGAGCLAAGSCPERWVDALEGLRADPGRGEALGRTARRRFVADHTWDAVLPGLERVYARTIGRGSAASPVVPVLR